VDKLTMLSQINLFEELPMEELQIIDEMSEMKPVKKGRLIQSPAQPLQSLFLLKKGQVRLYRMNESGKEFTVDILVDGNVFGETADIQLTDEDIYVQAMTDSYLCVLNKKEFESFIEKKPKIALKLIHILSLRLRDMYAMSEKIALMDVKSRILYLLLKLSERCGQQKNEWHKLNIKLTHLDIAHMVGSTRETVSGIMSSLQKQGIVKKRFRSLVIHPKKIQHFLDTPL
jgi:CRP-like cAMP-binding protein